jgi:hypothetical protein
MQTKQIKQPIRSAQSNIEWQDNYTCNTKHVMENRKGILEPFHGIGNNGEKEKDFLKQNTTENFRK